MTGMLIQLLRTNVMLTETRSKLPYLALMQITFIEVIKCNGAYRVLFCYSGLVSNSVESVYSALYF